MAYPPLQMCFTILFPTLSTSDFECSYTVGCHFHVLLFCFLRMIEIPDLCGRGYTEALADPSIQYDTNLYIIQLALLFQHVGFDKAIPVGYSMVCQPLKFESA